MSLAHGQSVYRTNAFGDFLVQQIEAGEYGYIRGVFSLKQDMLFRGSEKKSCAHLFYVQEGRISLTLKGRSPLRLRAGQYLPLFISPRTTSKVLMPEGRHIISQLRIPVDLLRYLADYDPAYRKIVASIDQRETIAIALAKQAVTEAIRKLLSEFSHCPAQEPARRLFLQGKTCLMLAHYHPTSHWPPSVSNYAKDRMSQVEAHIMANLQAQHTIRDLAGQFAIGERHLARQFREVHQMPIHQYIQIKRMEKAMELLGEDRMTILEICLDVGYNEVSSFNKAFVKHFGESPGHYRKAKKKDGR